MTSSTPRILVPLFLLLFSAAGTSRAQDMPADYTAVMTALSRKGDFKHGVLRINIPRTDLQVTIGQRPAPTPFGFGGWVAMTKAEGVIFQHYFGVGQADKLALGVRAAVDVLGKGR